MSINSVNLISVYKTANHISEFQEKPSLDLERIGRYFDHFREITEASKHPQASALLKDKNWEKNPLTAGQYILALEQAISAVDNKIQNLPFQSGQKELAKIRKLSEGVLLNQQGISDSAKTLIEENKQKLDEKITAASKILADREEVFNFREMVAALGKLDQEAQEILRPETPGILARIGIRPNQTQLQQKTAEIARKTAEIARNLFAMKNKGNELGGEFAENQGLAQLYKGIEEKLGRVDGNILDQEVKFALDQAKKLDAAYADLSALKAKMKSMNFQSQWHDGDGHRQLLERYNALSTRIDQLTKELRQRFKNPETNAIHAYFLGRKQNGGQSEIQGKVGKLKPLKEEIKKWLDTEPTEAEKRKIYWTQQWNRVADWVWVSTGIGNVLGKLASGYE